ncbi:MAG: 30S ribosomal protein S6 [Candidatus Bipolaricaulota bacterium]|nr:30S ribosomal protein S6 [Candidatus Bipolaricaulota bacterium]
MAGEVREYELVYILRPDLDEEGRRGKIAKVQGIIESENGSVRTTEEWGTRILAYEIEHFREGYYVFVAFTLPADRVRKVEERLQMDDALLRYQTVRVSKN